MAGSAFLRPTFPGWAFFRFFPKNIPEMVGLILIHCAILMFDTLEDWFKIKRLQRNIRHTLSALIITGLILATDVFFVWAWFYKSGGYFPYHLWNEAVAWHIMIPSFRWLWHDYGLNWLRGVDSEDLDTEGEQPHSDKFLIEVYRSANIPPKVTRVFAFAFSLLLSSIVLILF